MNDDAVRKSVESLLPAGLGASATRVPSARARAVNWMGQAKVLASKGDVDDAIRAYQEALKADPTCREALIALATTLAEQGLHARVLTALDKALVLAPERVDLLCRHADLLMALSKEEEALRMLERALEIDPQSVQASLPRAQALADRGQLTQAQAAPDGTRVKPLFNRGVAWARREDHGSALECYEQVLAIDGKHVGALLGGGAALEALNRLEEAVSWFQQALAVDSSHTGAWRSLGAALGRLQRYEEAIQSCDRVLQREPLDLHAGVNRATALFALYRLQEALQTLQPLLGRYPRSLAVLNAQAAVLSALNRDAEARAFTLQALEQQPDDATALNNLGLIELASGELLEGFRHQEARFRTAAYQGYMTALGSDAPVWRGEPGLQGKTLLLHDEGGYGDMLQFVRFVALVARTGARVVVRIQPALRELFATVQGVSAVISAGEPLPPHDLRCPMMSLGFIYGTTLASIPSDVPYLQADPVRAQAWRERLGPARRPRIGIVWAGRQYPPINIPRDMRLHMLLPLFKVDAEFISLQKEVPEADAALLASLPGLKRLGESLENFADTAALVAALDGVVTVDTAVLHLAAAMGKRVWVMNRFASCWRWLRDGRTDSPWYPTVRLVRQPELEDWQSVVNELKALLDIFVGDRHASHTAAAAPVRALPTRAPEAPLEQAPTEHAASDPPVPASPPAVSAPVSTDTLRAQARAALSRNDLRGALSCHLQLLAREPQRVELVNDCGALHGLLGELEEAVGLFHRALALDPKRADAHNHLGLALGKLGRHREAIPYLRRALELRAGYFDALCNLGHSLTELHVDQEALEVVDAALAIDSTHAGAHFTRAVALTRLWRLAEALKSMDVVVRARPDSATVLAAYAALLWQLNRSADARAVLTRARALDPGHINTLRTLAYVELGDGNLIEGFQHFDIRLEIEELSCGLFKSDAPRWRGEKLAGKTILVQREQGLGDTMQMLRFVLLFQPLGARVVLWVQPPLRELAAASLPGVSVISDGDPVPPHDFHCLTMSLPAVFGTTLTAMPCEVPYLQADPRRIEAWRKRLGPATRPRIGIVWAGRQKSPINVPRDMRLAQLLPLLTAVDAEFISLQKDVPAGDAELLGSLPGLRRLGEELGDFADTAALVANLDRVITVDTSMVHLVGAMGKTVWIMTNFACCWRWLRDGRTDSPWYPSARLFRQAALWDWESVVKEVTVALEIFVRQWRR